MLIRNISIIDTYNDTILRTIPFHLGANFVVDLELSTKHNKVGKTTFLKLIDVLMGANDKALIYKDKDTNNTNGALKAFIEDRKIAAEMVLTNNLDIASSSEDVRIRVELFPRGSYYIDEDKYTANDYRRELNTMLFGNDSNTPTLRQLIKSFVRVSVQGDDDSFLRNINRASTAEYRAVYNFLFDIADPSLDKKMGELNREKNKLLEVVRQYKKLNDIDDVDEQRQIIAALTRDRERLKIAADNIVDSGEYARNREHIAAIRSEYAALVETLNDLEYRIERNEEALRVAVEENGYQVDMPLIQTFFEEVCSMVPDINKTFNELLEFNRKVDENKVNYFSSIKNKLYAKKGEVEKRIESFVAENAQFMSLVSADKIEEYETLLGRLSEIQQSIGRRKEIVDMLEKFDTDLSRIDTSLSEYSEGMVNDEETAERYQERMNSFNAFFTPFAERINGERPILVYLPDLSKFPVSITEIDGSSTGTRKSLIAAYDLAYQRFAAESGLTIPQFDVHDVLENIEGESLKAIVDIANQSGSQYVIAVLKEKLDSSGFTDVEQEKYGILQLAEDDRLFEGKSIVAGVSKGEVTQSAVAILKDASRTEAEFLNVA